MTEPTYEPYRQILYDRYQIRKQVISSTRKSSQRDSRQTSKG
jgi:hypothetical protein